MREAQELLRMARSLAGGTIHPPPAMVDEIYRWSEAQIAAYRVKSNQKSIEEDRQFMEQALNKAKESREKIQKLIDDGLSPDRMKLEREYAEERERRAEQFRDAIETREKRVAELLAIVKSFPRVQIKKWSRVKRKFVADMTGWRYLSKVKAADPMRKAYADNSFGVITVELVKGDLQTKGKGYWLANNATLRIRIGGDLHWIIEHELAHWAQSYMNVLIGKSGQFGMPSQRDKTPDVIQRAKGPEARKLKQKGIEPSEFHNLDDVEFYTDLADEIRAFKLKTKNALEYFGTKDTFFKVFIGMEDPVRYGLGFRGKHYVSKYFKALKKHARGKWQKAVKELAKAVL